MSKILYGLDPQEYEHPLDREALNALQKISGIQAIFQKFQGSTVEKAMILQHKGEKLKVNENNSKTKNIPVKPILVKVAPDMSVEQLELIVKTAIESGCSGIVATNTTISRVEQLDGKDAKTMAETGGMSGLPLVDKSTEFIRLIYQMTNGNLPIVGVGGIMNAEHAWQKITAGATLLQAYSAFVFQGPSISKNIVKGLNKKLREHNLTSIEQAIGLDHKGDD